MSYSILSRPFFRVDPTFKQGLKLEDLEAQLEAGYEPRATLSDSGWEL